MSTEAKFVDSATAKKAGWFSRRHRTSEAHVEAQRLREAKRLLKGKPR